MYLDANNHWYLHANSCLHHKHHPSLDDCARLRSSKDMNALEMNLMNIMYDATLPPSKVSQVLSIVNTDEKGTYLPKTLFNVTEKCRNLEDVANGILPTCSDAEKTIKYLQL